MSKIIFKIIFESISRILISVIIIFFFYIFFRLSFVTVIFFSFIAILLSIVGAISEHSFDQSKYSSFEDMEKKKGITKSKSIKKSILKKDRKDFSDSSSTISLQRESFVYDDSCKSNQVFEEIKGEKSSIDLPISEAINENFDSNLSDKKIEKSSVDIPISEVINDGFNNNRVIEKIKSDTINLNTEIKLVEMPSMPSISSSGINNVVLNTNINISSLDLTQSSNKESEKDKIGTSVPEFVKVPKLFGKD